MARVFSTLHKCFSAGIRQQCTQSGGQNISVQRMLFSSTSKGSVDPQEQDNNSGKQVLPKEAIFYHPKHDMYVCWHPEVPFPYEMSKPIPQETHVTESSLKIQALTPVREIFRKKDDRLMIRELMQLTYTAKYKWLGKHGRKKRAVFKDMDPLKQKRDREYL